MELALPLFDSRLVSAIKGEGKYRLHFSVGTWIFGTPFKQGERKEAGPYVVTITKVTEDRINDKLIVDVLATPNLNPKPSQAGVGAGVIILAAIVVGGVSLLFLSLDRVEKIIESPAGQATVLGTVFIVVALVIGGALFYFKKLRGK